MRVMWRWPGFSILSESVVVVFVGLGARVMLVRVGSVMERGSVITSI